MPRISLTDQENALLGRALAIDATVRGLTPGEALASAALTTLVELRALVLNRLTLMRADAIVIRDTADAQAAGLKSRFDTEIAAIDSVLTKL